MRWLSGSLTERLTQGHVERAVQRSRRADRLAEALTRNVEVKAAMGMTRAAVQARRARQEVMLQAQTQLHPQRLAAAPARERAGALA